VHSQRPAAGALARIAYLAIVLYATLRDLEPDPNTALVPERFVRAFDLTLHMSDAVDGVRNIILFAGLGAVWVITSNSSKLSRSTWHVTVLGCLIGCFVESCQLLSPVRHSSIIDVATNTLGAFLGAVAIDLIITWLRTDTDRPSILGIPAVVFASTYGISVFMEAFMPLFRQAETIPNLGGGVVERIVRAWHAIQPSSITYFPAIDLALFAPAGVFAVVALVEAGVTRTAAWIIVTLLALCLAPFAEVFHGVASQAILLGPILWHIIAVSGAALMTAYALPWFTGRWTGARRVRLLCIAYCGVVALWSWRPFIPELNAQSIDEQFSPIHWIPLQALAIRFDLFTVTDVITQFVLYLPLGALLAIWPLRTRGAWRDLLPAFYLSLVTELGKIVVADRFFDVTHILIQVAAAAIGWALVRRAGFTIAGEVWGEELA
jgi:glycopeptide antibiotics resistance protein